MFGERELTVLSLCSAGWDFRANLHVKLFQSEACFFDCCAFGPFLNFSQLPCTTKFKIEPKCAAVKVTLLNEVFLVMQNKIHAFVRTRTLDFINLICRFFGDPNLRILQLAVSPIPHSTTVAINGYEAWSLMTQTCLLFTFHCSQFHKLNWSLKWFQKFYRFYKSQAWDWIFNLEVTIFFLIGKWIWFLLDLWSQNAQHFLLKFSEGNCYFSLVFTFPL